MKRFTKKHRDQSMVHTVSFHGVPMFRGLAFAINHIEEHGGKVIISSADRRDTVLREHNLVFGTNLHGQQYLFDRQGLPGFNPANPPNRTSHCLYSDGNPVYRNSRGQHIRAGSKLPWYELGIDLRDSNDNDDEAPRFLKVAHSLGYHFVNPYSSGSERHHVVCSQSPIQTLEYWNVISKHRKG